MECYALSFVPAGFVTKIPNIHILSPEATLGFPIVGIRIKRGYK